MDVGKLMYVFEFVFILKFGPILSQILTHMIDLTIENFLLRLFVSYIVNLFLTTAAELRPRKKTVAALLRTTQIQNSCCGAINS